VATIISRKEQAVLIAWTNWRRHHHQPHAKEFGSPKTSDTVGNADQQISCFFAVDSSHTTLRKECMKQHQARVVKRLAAGLLATMIVVAVGALAIHAPVDAQNRVAGSLKNIRTDKATLFYADARPSEARFVEQTYPITDEGEAATEDFKLIAATF
jgi:hypothetical protein